MRRVEKSWGHELVWAETDRYVAKLLYMRCGGAMSLLYHERKDETIMVWSGRARVEQYDEGQEPQLIELGPRQSLRVPPLRRHRVIALEDTVIFEVSTPELDDAVRL